MVNNIKLIPLILFALAFVATTSASASGLRVTCDGDDVGAEVQINGKFKGECPVDITIPEGTYKLRVFKAVDASHERVFEQVIRMGDGVMKKVEAVLTSQLTAAGRAESLRIRARFDAELANGTLQARFRDCADCPEMVAIPPGAFDMGSDNGSGDEKPVHRVILEKPFALGKTEVTQGQWRAIMGNNPSNFTGCGDDCPVEQVSWNDVQTFIYQLNAKTGKQYRLPSEAEWEYACRAGGAHQYCGSDNLDSVAWYGAYGDPVGNSAKTTNRVATKQANAFGLYDMSGNVWEWVEDSYHDNYINAPINGSVWPGDGAKRVLRGGSWYSGPQYARAAYRLRNEPADRNISIGFRLARMLP